MIARAVLASWLIAVAADAQPAQCSARLRFVEGALERSSTNVRRWAWIWGGIGVGLAATNFTIAATTSKPDTRTNALIAGSASLLLPTYLIALPPRELEPLPRGGDDVCMALATAEERLVKDAEYQRRQHAWPANVAPLAFNLVLGTVIGPILGHWRAAAIQVSVGTIIGESQVFTRPTTAAEALEEYRTAAFH
jgi:hypothetical protein